MKVKEIEATIGTLSTPSKMPGHGYSTPAEYCKTGSKLRKVKGSVCADCYACKGRYVFPNVQKALKKRYNSITDPMWPFHMAALIKKKEKSGYFRWHDSGDIIDLDHLKKIVAVANMLPEIKFWIPSREYAIVRQYEKQYGKFPDNLCVRSSAHMVNGKAPAGFENTSTVITKDRIKQNKDQTCPATLPDSDHKCNDCRKCWDKSIKNIAYIKH